MNKNQETIIISSNISTNIKKDKFRRSTVIYNFIDFIVKNIYLINDHLDIKTE